MYGITLAPHAVVYHKHFPPVGLYIRKSLSFQDAAASPSEPSALSPSFAVGPCVCPFLFLPGQLLYSLSLPDPSLIWTYLSQSPQ